VPVHVPTTYSLDIPPRLLLLQEIQHITSSMRRSPRWSSPASSSSAAYYSATHRRQTSISEVAFTNEPTGPGGRERALASSDAIRRVSDDSSVTKAANPTVNSYGKRLVQGEGEEMELLAAFVGLRRELNGVQGQRSCTIVVVSYFTQLSCCIL
jgi:hypothetical protein